MQRQPKPGGQGVHAANARMGGISSDVRAPPRNKVLEKQNVSLFCFGAVTRYFANGVYTCVCTQMALYETGGVPPPRAKHPYGGGASIPPPQVGEVAARAGFLSTVRCYVTHAAF